MTTTVLLLAAVALVVVGCAVYLLRTRTPTSLEDGIEGFAREMRALAPERTPAVGMGGAPAPAPPADPGPPPASGGERKG